MGQRRHRALEIYVSVFQFTSARAAADYAGPPKLGPNATAGLASAGAATAIGLGKRLLAQVGDRADGTTADFARSASGLRAAQWDAYFSRWLPVYPQGQGGAAAVL